MGIAGNVKSVFHRFVEQFSQKNKTRKQKKILILDHYYYKLEKLKAERQNMVHWGPTVAIRFGKSHLFLF